MINVNYEIQSTNPAYMESIETINVPDREVIVLDDSQESVADSEHNNVSSFDIITLDDTALSADTYKDSINSDENINVESRNISLQDSKLPDDGQPLFKVIFRDENVARKHRKQVRTFLESLISTEPNKNEDSDRDLVLEIWGKEIDSNKSDDDVCIKSDKVEDSSGNTLFTVDTNPKQKNNYAIPTYGKKYKQLLEKSGTEDKSESKDACTPKLNCFNCSGDHNLRDCTKPRDYNNINKNRKEHNAKMGPRYSRYHLDDDQRFGHLIPGQISNNLRKALGLKDNDLPKHIYRMRILGYPPGWLEEARLQHSGITLFNSDGTVEADPNEDEGEIIAEGDKDQFDVKKIYDYPGFNVPPPPGTREEYKHGAPRMQPQHSKEAMLLMLSGRKADEGYKRKKMKTAETKSIDAIVVPSEMDIDEGEAINGLVESIPSNGHFIPPLPRDIPVRPPPPPGVSEDSNSQSQGSHSPDSINESTTPSSRANSPSLSDLESAKKLLLEELDDSSSHSNLESPAGISNNALITSTPTTPGVKMSVSSCVVTPQTSRTHSARKTLNDSCGSVKSVELGTPLIHSTSPYNKLPSSEKFSKDICDVLHFETLPDSTGKYEQMSGLIQKVRTTLAKIQQE
ncbi:zinc finger CCHC domain-containing protein 8 homolog isoform X2 [Cephus cinctus]|uniref:Zinc finger CCHC domain-containing protein 8 homolog isoform X2 n=1 Tax=Cephus cinctus TaxID=211228 RepID=A0AAJ7BTK8_CEPCN|nr:zinc finger CCHC domain-containing protein 8 homolog isoform X2 [Cephus cinctus]